MVCTPQAHKEAQTFVLQETYCASDRRAMLNSGLLVGRHSRCSVFQPVRAQCREQAAEVAQGAEGASAPVWQIDQPRAGSRV